MHTFQSVPSRVARLLVVAAAGFALFGCASIKMPAPQASVDNVTALRGANLAPVKAGAFSVAVGVDPKLDTSLGGLRGSSLAPASGTFSQYLRDQIVAELKAAGLYDEAASAAIQAELNESKVDAAIGTGSGSLGAHFSVTRDGRKVFDKTLRVESTWDSSFVGAIAIPAAAQQYNALYKALAAKLFADADFRAALAR